MLLIFIRESLSENQNIGGSGRRHSHYAVGVAEDHVVRIHDDPPDTDGNLYQPV